MVRSSLPMMGCLLLCLWVAFAEAGLMKYKDPRQPLNARVKDLMGRMTLEEKIGQMVQIERKVASADVMSKYFIGIQSSFISLLFCNLFRDPFFFFKFEDFIIAFVLFELLFVYVNGLICTEDKLTWAGSVLSGGGSVPAPKASAETWVNMVNDFQKGSLSTRLGIPMIYGIDAVHGHNNAYGATIFPQNVGLGVTRQVDVSWIKNFPITIFIPKRVISPHGFLY
ncbi:beta-glucosidase [Sarracenia purpurea var. burkii]